MKARWEHKCSDCNLIVQTKLSDIYKCTETDSIVFRWGEGNKSAININYKEVQAAVS